MWFNGYYGRVDWWWWIYRVNRINIPGEFTDLYEANIPQMKLLLNSVEIPGPHTDAGFRDRASHACSFERNGISIVLDDFVVLLAEAIVPASISGRGQRVFPVEACPLEHLLKINFLKISFRPPYNAARLAARITKDGSLELTATHSNSEFLVDDWRRRDM